MQINLFGRVRESIVDGPGMRYAIFVQGCPRSCEGCHNPQSQPFKGGEQIEINALINDILHHSELISGITLSGGEPFSQAKPLSEVAKAVRERGLTVWTFTGYILETLIAESTPENAWQDLLNQTDVLVDGPFILSERTLSRPFVGSKNQRIIHLREE